MRVLKRAGLSPIEISRLEQYNDLLRYLRGNPLAIQVILPELKRQAPEKLLERLQSGEAKLPEDEAGAGQGEIAGGFADLPPERAGPTAAQTAGHAWRCSRDSWMRMYWGGCARLRAHPRRSPDWRGQGWVEILDTAAEVGLLHKAGEGYYTIHPALPWFFHDLLLEGYPEQRGWFEMAFCKIYGEYGSYLTDLFKKNPQLAMSLLQAEEPNLLHALRLAQEGELWDVINYITYGICRLMTLQGRWVEWERMVTALELRVVDEQGGTFAWQGGFCGERFSATGPRSRITGGT